MELTQSDARKLFLKQQGLLRDNEFGRGKNATNKAIQRLSYVQIDTISVINRAHQHVLYNRVGNYNPTHLEKLVQQREVFEYWSCFLYTFDDADDSLRVDLGGSPIHSNNKG